MRTGASSRGCRASRRAPARVDAVVVSGSVLPSQPRAVVAFIVALVVSAPVSAVSAVSAALVPSPSATFILIATVVPIFSSVSIIISIVPPSSDIVVLDIVLVVVGVVMASPACVPLRESSAAVLVSAA